MKIILTMNIPYLRIDGGANKSNRVLCEELSQLGNEVTVVSPSYEIESSL